MAIITREEIIKELGLESLDYETQQKALENIATAVSKRIWRKISETLSEQDLDVIDDLMQDDKNEEIEKLIRSKFSNYDEFAISTEREVINDIARDKQASEETLKKLQETGPDDSSE